MSIPASNPVVAAMPLVFVPLRHFLTDHDVATAYERGWSSVTNGDLIRLATDSIVAAIRGIQAGSYQELVIP